MLKVVKFILFWTFLKFLLSLTDAQDVLNQEKKSSLICGNTVCFANKSETCVTKDDKKFCDCLNGFKRLGNGECTRSFVYFLQLAFTLDFDPEFENHASNQFKNLSTNFTRWFDSYLENYPQRNDFLGKDIHKVHCGSTIIDVYVYMSRPTSVDNLKSHFHVTTFSDSFLQLKKVISVQETSNCKSNIFHYCGENSICHEENRILRCACADGYLDTGILYPGETCSAICPMNYCEDGICVIKNKQPVCKCHSLYTGSRCQYDMKILAILSIPVLIVLIGGILYLYHKCNNDDEKKSEAFEKNKPSDGVISVAYVDTENFHPASLSKNLQANNPLFQEDSKIDIAL